jgi:hypothetical protein
MHAAIRMASIIPALMLALAAGMALAQPSESKYVIKGDEVFDRKTELTWQRCSVGQQWGGDSKACVGAVKQFNFDAAQKLGSETWRVPSKDELATLVDVSKLGKGKYPLIDEAAFPDMDPTKLVYWTSTSDKTLFAWTILFGESESYVYSGPRKQMLAVRLVRGGRTAQRNPN